ncbi:response regulator [Puniceicoccaceae bacterium K14]|nr:response regulator [Puniceicoccaceae bacterium K14]
MAELSQSASLEQRGQDPHGLAMPRGLFMDDSLFTHELLTTVGYKAGVSFVSKCINAEEAFEAALKLEPDFALLDLRIPGKTSGLVVAIKLKREFPDMPIALFTGEPGVAIEHQVRYHGLNGIITKGCHLNELITSLKALAGGAELWQVESGRPFISQNLDEWESLLSDNEIAALPCFARSWVDTQIAKAVNVDVQTVCDMRSRLQRVLELEDFELVDTLTGMGFQYLELNRFDPVEL